MYNKPAINVYIGFIFETGRGIIATGFGAFIMKNMFSILNDFADFDKMRKDVDLWCLIMFLTAIFSFFCTFIAKSAFGVVGENITKFVRGDLYTEIIKKHIGWHDDS